MRTESSAKLASAEHRAQLADATRQARSVRGAGAIDYFCIPSLTIAIAVILCLVSPVTSMLLAHPVYRIWGSTQPVARAAISDGARG